MKKDLREFIHEQGLTPYEVSKMSGVPRSTIYDLVNKKGAFENMSIITAYKIAKVLGIKIEDFIEKFE